jgi:hypothetical protein
VLFGALGLDAPIRHVEVVGRLPDSSFGIPTVMWPFLDIKYAEREEEENAKQVLDINQNRF